MYGQEYYFNINPKFSQDIFSVIPSELSIDNSITLWKEERNIDYNKEYNCSLFWNRTLVHL